MIIIIHLLLLPQYYYNDSLMDVLFLHLLGCTLFVKKCEEIFKICK